VHIFLIGVGTRMRPWVEEAYREYAKRLPPECALRLVEVPAGRRGKGLDPRRAVAQEGNRMLRAIPPGSWVIALAPDGRPWSTEQLAAELGLRLAAGRDLALLVGGPDGLAGPCRARADALWSLSRLTLPHPLVRVILAEQLYRAWSLLRGHPYHRA
jgi:23S rRNA (pseudouridine1915-N3)-methyltransferase